MHHANPLPRIDSDNFEKSLKDGESENEKPVEEAFDQEKAQQIQEASQWRDTERLRGLAETKGGLLNDVLRSRAWPILLGVSGSTDEGIDEKTGKKNEHSNDGVVSDDWKNLPPHKDEHQVELDVNRSFIYYPNSMPPISLTPELTPFSLTTNY